MTELRNYVNYRAANPFDLRQILALDYERVDGEERLPPKSEKWWADRLNDGEALHTVIHIAVHIDTKVVVGYIVTTWLTHNTIRIDRLRVGTNFRRIRIGTRLLLRILSDKPPAVTRLTYVVPEQDLNSQLFLRSVGFIANRKMKHGAFPSTETGIGIKFEWNETLDAI